MVLRLLLSPITAPFEGVIWIGEQLLERAEAELDDKENLGKRLLALQLAFDMGDIAEEDFEVQEEELLLQIQDLEDEANREENEID
ncbi:gas vesicle protein GvpG [Planktothrix paucivesiculata]|uniref:Gas vesicle protein GvpG n=1 Tax=Planktothrix paucivesiculata PCC 9631 TaxID=671071 RepID=A0A7Z9DXL2_9CYAN|nr:gas vesicle protein GvpG [Planktothrix paucivesiculata]VXD11440.1 Gas vesicle protein GvpG [Planktothrix paucivesiculata PCC 9631]